MPTRKNRLALRENNKFEGRYANYFKVGHNAFEFVIDFGQYYTESEEMGPYTRIITSPIYAKSFFKVLQESIEQYERVYGIIRTLDQVSKLEE